MSIFLILLLINCCFGAEKLSKYNADPSETSVSGLSSGAFFATQMQIAFSESIKGAGIVAGGPYDCAAQTSYTSCMYSSNPSITKSISNTKLWSGNKIDDIKNLSRQKVYMISGTSDTTVSVSIMNQLYKYYVTEGQFIPSENVVFKKDLKAAHTFPTDFDSTGNNPCTSASSPYVSNCGFDGAEAILKHIYGPLKAKNTGSLTGKFIEIDQSEFLTNPRSSGMSMTGWVYVPKSCDNGEVCKLHIAYHGCLQGYEKIGDKYVKNTGYNRWADTNNIIVLYPQAVATTTRSLTDRAPFPNMNGCWDWIGWYGTDFNHKTGKQSAAMKKMIDRVVSGFNPIDPPTQLKIDSITDNSISLSWNQVIGASGYNIYRNGQKVNQFIITDNKFLDNNLNSGSTYTFIVKSLSSQGTESISSNTVTGKTTGESPSVEVPNGLTITDITLNSISLSWTSSSTAEQYNIYRNGNKIATVSLTTYKDINLNSNTEYKYQITSLKDSQESEKSLEVKASTLMEKVCFNDNNYNHVVAGRARQSGGYVFANGSNQNMGLYNTFTRTNLCKTQDNHYIIG
ncbi:unnamed protein product [Adineta steineri]|uniref:Fibronectin type-III domain-containing protein n=1 Tax=Adineta steineri TaxID=433720 RepID=A0A813R163_9BILA|nr:unnamed protein product [Adineta steineri]CAF3811787.1 unnamed protein product [Adineta steineri]